MRVRKSWWSYLFIIITLAGLLLSGCSLNTITEISKDGADSAKVTGAVSGNLKITMLDVGQGLSILIFCDGEYMLYDGGGRDASSYVVSYMKNHDIEAFKYIVASHYDEDHIAGLVGVLSNYDVSEAIIPDYEADSEIYDSFMNKLDWSDAAITHPSTGDVFKLGSAEITVLGPDEYDSEDENDRSIVMRLSMGDFSCLMTGDAEEQEEQEMINADMELASTILVVGHHGSSSSTSTDFLNAVDPVYALISVGEGNSYGHPTRKTLNRLKKAGVKMYRTDKQGEISVTSDGKSWEFSEKASSDWTAGTYQEETSVDRNIIPSSEDSASSNNSGKYVLNNNSMKFHKPGCSSVKQMKESNRVYTDKSRDELIKEGYDPCGNCNP